MLSSPVSRLADKSEAPQTETNVPSSCSILNVHSEHCAHCQTVNANTEAAAATTIPQPQQLGRSESTWTCSEMQTTPCWSPSLLLRQRGKKRAFCFKRAPNVKVLLLPSSPATTICGGRSDFGISTIWTGSSGCIHHRR